MPVQMSGAVERARIRTLGLSTLGSARVQSAQVRSFDAESRSFSIASFALPAHMPGGQLWLRSLLSADAPILHTYLA